MGIELIEIGQDVWMVNYGFKMFSLVEIGNHGVLIKIREGEMAMVNLPTLKLSELEEIRKFCEVDQHAELRYLIETGDWHHFGIKTWADAFPKALMYVVSERPMIVNKDVKSVVDRLTVLDYESPMIKELEDEIQLLPVLGCIQPSLDKSGLTPRCEVVVFHKKSGTLYITDHCFGSSDGGSWWFRFVSQSFSVWPFSSKKSANSSTFRIATNRLGFRVGVPETANKSMRRILSLDGIKRLVFSHGRKKDCLYEGKDIYEILEAGYMGHFLLPDI